MNIQLLQSLDGSLPPSGWWGSEKLDGQRALWDSGVTAGVPVSEIPWANGKPGEVATGLWTRGNGVLHAPADFTASLPRFLLDGELYMGRGSWGKLRSVIARKTAKSWEGVRFVATDAPAPEVVFSDSPEWAAKMRGLCGPDAPYRDVYAKILEGYGDVIRQETDPNRAGGLFADVIGNGGEGIVWRDPGAAYQTERTWSVRKQKALRDSEGTVAGYIAGRGRFLGMIGAAIVQWGGVEFELCGFSNEERALNPEAEEWARGNAGARIPACIGAAKTKNALIPVGGVVTFQYRTVADRKPIEARFLRSGVETERDT